MRSATLALVCALSSTAHAFKFSDLFTGKTHAVSSEVLSHKVAIIGAGAGGTSAAFWIAKAKSRSKVAVEVDIFERSGYVGGRSTVIYPYNDTTLDPVELGASIFVESNKNLWRASEEFGLERLKFDDDEQGVGFWDGEKFVFRMNEGRGVFGWWESIKAVWRYGWVSPKRTADLVKAMVKQYRTLYTPDSPVWANITTLVSELGWDNLTDQTAAEFLDSRGVLPRFSREVVEAATRVNYGHNVDEIHAVGGQVSLAADRASGIKGGNYQLFSGFLARSGATIHLNTSVLSIKETRHKTWVLQTHPDPRDSEAVPVKEYNDVIIAAPFHSTGISVLGATTWTFTNSEPHTAPIPEQPYVHLHVTLLATTAKHPNPAYFGLSPKSVVPQVILTTYEGARAGGPAPEFNSLTYHGKVAPTRDEYVVKIFSREKLSDKWLASVFGDTIGWVNRKEWDAYPLLPPTTSYPPVLLAQGLYYVNAFEPLISTMETETVASRNIVDLIFRHRFGTGICGKASALPTTEPTAATADSPTPAPEPAPASEPVLTPVGSNAEQVVLDAPVEAVNSESASESSTTKSDTKTKTKSGGKTRSMTASDDFVLGWDC